MTVWKPKEQYTSYDLPTCPSCGKRHVEQDDVDFLCASGDSLTVSCSCGTVYEAKVALIHVIMVNTVIGDKQS